MNNMEEWKKIKISDIGRIVTGKTPRTSIKENYGGYIPFLTPSDDLSNKFAPITNKVLTDKGLMEVRNCLLPENSICVSCIGSDLGKVVMLKKPTVTNQQFNSIIPNENYSPDFVYYLMIIVGKRLNFLSKTSTAVPIINKSTFSNFEVEVPSSLRNQTQIAKILSSLDDKIELNNRINANLEEQAQTLFHRWFVDFEFPNEQGLPYKSNGGAFIDSELGRIPNGWKVFHADEVFHINIGKTPPRKEQEWFSNESKNNIKWVSISDLGGIGVFVNDSKEYLSKDAISKFNIIVVPRNTVLLSFKLTVGRVAIANCKLTTNEAIARFYLPKEYFREYTYLALKNYNYSKLGSTSSIAIAVNSKIIKAMPILIPSDNILKLFNVVMAPVFNIIEKNQTTIENLVSLRDTLLPKLMNNEINL